MAAVIIVRPHRGRWQSYEDEGVKPYCCGPGAKEYGLSYANRSARYRVRLESSSFVELWACKLGSTSQAPSDVIVDE
ncbi:MAG: hypothetical protein ABR589_08620 [Chthoniobacterales bacterium]